MANAKNKNTKTTAKNNSRKRNNKSSEKTNKEEDIKNGKDAYGRFKKGHKLAPKKRTFTAKHTALREELTSAFLESNKDHLLNGDFERVISKLYLMAMSGEIAAIKLLLDKTLGSNFNINLDKNEKIQFTLSVNNNNEKNDNKINEKTIDGILYDSNDDDSIDNSS